MTLKPATSTEVTEMLADIQDADGNPPDLPRATQLQDDGGVNVGAVAQRPNFLEHGGYVHVWDTETGDCSTIMKTMLLGQLKKLRPNGSRFFATAKPPVEPFVGTIVCHLHADSDMKATYQRLGVDTTCGRARMPSLQDLEWHMQNRHKREYARYQRDVEEQRTQEATQLARLQLEAQSRNNELIVQLLERGIDPPKAGK